jgi:hypothetical protein
MSEPILSILIPTLEKREAIFNRLNNFLLAQIQKYELQEKVVIIPLKNNGEHNIGKLRNMLASMCQTAYSDFIDDDDMVDSFFLKDIVNVLETENPDAVGFRGIYKDIKTQTTKPFVVRCGEKYEERDNCFYRPPNHISPKRNEFNLKVPFPDVKFGEDHSQCINLKNSGLLQSCSFIDKNMYYYLYDSTKK